MAWYKQFAIDLPLPSTDDAARAIAPEEARNEVLRLFDECSPRLRRYIRSFGLSADVTDDVLQDVFFSLFRHLLCGRSRRNLTGWLFQVSHNLALRQRRRSARLGRREGAWEVVLNESLIDPGDNPERRLAANRRQTRLLAVLRAMPERDRRCLYLRAEGLRYREIAKALDVSLGCVAKSLTRALTRLTNADSG